MTCEIDRHISHVIVYFILHRTRANIIHPTANRRIDNLLYPNILFLLFYKIHVPLNLNALMVDVKHFHFVQQSE